MVSSVVIGHADGGELETEDEVFDRGYLSGVRDALMREHDAVDAELDALVEAFFARERERVHELLEGRTAV